MSKGSLIAFEGLSGCGKEMQIEMLKKHITDKGFKCVELHFPGFYRLTYIEKNFKELK